jgi:hypothetical protein
VKLVAAVLTPLVVFVLALPLLMSGAAAPLGIACGDTAVILETIRTVETGGNYETRITSSTASGAYAMLDGVWRHWSAIAGYPDRWPRAWMAPPAAQDAAAAALLESILNEWHDIAAVPVSWYYPIALRRHELMDIVPMPEAGNNLTPRQYQAQWLRVHEEKVGQAASCVPVVGGEWALPVPRELIDRAPHLLLTPHHDYPAWDFGIPVNTPIYAVHAGVVARITTWTGNCYRDPSSCVQKCGVGLSIEDENGVRYVYCHGTRLLVGFGDHVGAGQQIMWSGDTGHSSGPHLHFGIRIGGVDYCPQPLLHGIHKGKQPSPISSLPTAGCAVL